MKAGILSAGSIFIFAMILISCDNQFEPKTDFHNGYILNCIIESDTTFQLATISRRYDVEGLSPASNNVDPFVGGAKITLTCYNQMGTENYEFRDTLINRSDDSRYNTPIHCYYLNNFNPKIGWNEINPGVFSYQPYTMLITAILQDGTTLKAYAGSVSVKAATVENYKEGNPIAMLPGKISFETVSNSFSYLGWYDEYYPELIINYSKLENGQWVNYQKLIPEFYTTGDNPGIPVYPIINKNEKYVNYDSTAIRKTLEDISADDDNKNNYLINKVVFYLHITDINFGTYLIYQQTFLNEFSIRTTQLDYNNVSGGLGIFGAMYTIEKEVPLNNMINSIGYRSTK